MRSIPASIALLALCACGPSTSLDKTKEQVRAREKVAADLGKSMREGGYYDYDATTSGLLSDTLVISWSQCSAGLLAGIKDQGEMKRIGFTDLKCKAPAQTYTLSLY